MEDAALQSRYVDQDRSVPCIRWIWIYNLRLFSHHIGSGPIRLADSLHAQGQASGIFIYPSMQKVGQVAKREIMRNHRYWKATCFSPLSICACKHYAVRPVQSISLRKCLHLNQTA